MISRSLIMLALATAPVATFVPAGPVHAKRVYTKMCSADQRKLVEETFAAALPIVKAASSALRDMSRSSNQTAYVTYFGPRNSQREAAVASVYARTQAFLEAKKDMTVECNSPSRCDPGDYAVVNRAYPDAVVFCSVFFDKNTPPRYGDSRAGTLVHEITHLAAGTRDHGYGMQTAKNFGKGDQPKAITNADNFLYFAAAVHGR